MYLFPFIIGILLGTILGMLMFNTDSVYNLLARKTKYYLAEDIEFKHSNRQSYRIFKVTTTFFGMKRKKQMEQVICTKEEAVRILENFKKYGHKYLKVKD